MPSYEFLWSRSPWDKLKVREIFVNGEEYGGVRIELWDCFIWTPLESEIMKIILKLLVSAQPDKVC